MIKPGTHCKYRYVNMPFTRDHLEQQMTQLPCFIGKVCQIEAIEQGYSHCCFKVKVVADDDTEQQFFVKYLMNDQTLISQERVVTELTSTAGLSPQLLHHTSCWLVSEFVVADSLQNAALDQKTKLALAAKLLNRCHQISLDASVASLTISEILGRQLSAVKFNDSQQNILTNIIEQVTDFEETGTKVLCHGDANFSNILLDREGQCWLIDFECAFIGCREFDLAMLMAINHLPLQQLEPLLKAYQAVDGCIIDMSLLDHYLRCCYLINGLWFYCHSDGQKNSELYHRLAQQQLTAFDQLHCVPQQIATLLFP